MKRELLIDADVVAYKAASSVEVATDWGDGYWTWHCDFNAVEDAFWASIGQTMKDLGGDSYKLCLTDSLGNFRKRILPTYKGNRASTKRPLVLAHFKDVLIQKHDAYFRHGLEGDDCMGILATIKTPGVEKVIVSIDKDMKTIPGLFSRDGKSIETIDQETADYWHLYQTLTGDTTDGYSGCPGIGPKKAETILEQAGADPWSAIVAVYEKAKLGEEEALTQARVARILRASDYDFEKKEPILWTPKTAA